MAQADDRLADIERRLCRVEWALRNGQYLDAMARRFRAEADITVVGVYEGETIITFGDYDLHRDLTINGNWIVGDLPGGAGNAAGMTGVSFPLE